MKFMLIILTILQSLFATLEKKTLVADFSITITEQQAQPMTYTGSLSMRGKQFSLEKIGMEAAYDGTTMYMYREDADELILSNPTEEELTETNPFLYAKALLPVCKQTEKVIGDNTQITLIPKNQNDDISQFILRMATNSLLPISVEIHESTGKITTLRLKNAQYTDSVPSFVIEKADAFINDLR